MEQKNKKKNIAKLVAGAPLLAGGAYALSKGKPILKNRITNPKDGEYAANYIRFADNMLSKSMAGRKATNFHRKILQNKEKDLTKGEKFWGNVMLGGKPPKDKLHQSEHYVEFGSGPQKALDHWFKEVKHHAVDKKLKKAKDSGNTKKVESLKRRAKDYDNKYKTLKNEISENDDVYSGLENAKETDSKQLLKMMRAEKKVPGDIIYPSMVGGISSVGLGAGGALTYSGLKKEGAKKDDKIENYIESGAAGALSAGSLSYPKLREKSLKDKKVNIDPSNKKLTIVTEGGKHNPGGGGHEAAAKAISKEYDKIHGKGSSQVVNFTDYSYAKNKPLSKFNKARYKGMTSPDSGRISKALNTLGYITGFGSMRATDSNKMRKDLKGSGRVIATQPDAVNFVKPLGISPELVATDYGIDKGEAKSFWNMAYGLTGTDKDSISKAYAPTKGGEKVFKEKGTKTKSIPSVPLDDKFMGDSKKEKLKELDLFDNEGNSKGKKVKFNPNKKLVVVSGGSTGHDVDTISKQIAESGRKDIQVVGVSGKNKKVQKAMEGIDGVISQGYEKNFDKLMDSADVVVARPHGISTTEAIAKGKPVIPAVTNRTKDSYAPHMTGNAEHFSKLQEGMPIGVLDEDSSVKNSINEVIDNIDKYKSKAQNASKKIKQNAAKQIAQDASETKNINYKLPRSIKGPAIATGIGSGAYAVKKFLDAKEKSKSDKLTKKAIFNKNPDIKIQSDLENLGKKVDYLYSQDNDQPVKKRAKQLLDETRNKKNNYKDYIKKNKKWEHLNKFKDIERKAINLRHRKS